MSKWQADSAAEAIAFMAASIMKAGPETSAFLVSKILVVEGPKSRRSCQLRTGSTSSSLRQQRELDRRSRERAKQVCLSTCQLGCRSLLVEENCGR